MSSGAPCWRRHMRSEYTQRRGGGVGRGRSPANVLRTARIHAFYWEEWVLERPAGEGLCQVSIYTEWLPKLVIRSKHLLFGQIHLPWIHCFCIHNIPGCVNHIRNNACGYILLVIRFMADLLRKYRGSVVIMVGRGGAEPHYVHNWPPIFSW